MFPLRYRASRRRQASAQSDDTIVPSLANSSEINNRVLQESDPDIDPTSPAHPRLSSTPVDATRAGYDDYGSELGKDARVWSAYVKEAEQWDDEMVDGWNKYAAALFSAVSTTFVVESSKKLQPDPGDISATALVEISQILRSMSNNRSAGGLPEPTASTEFSPASSDIWVNLLWFLSLALSVSVSLVTMLAKQWCYSYMSGRAGQPHVQARTRQMRLEELERWKMPEILAFLPTLMHLSLFLFFVGLIINLWFTHIGIASAVLATTIITVLFYAVTTLLPLYYELCPYGTPLSKFIQGCPNIFEVVKDNGPGLLQRLYQIFKSPDLAIQLIRRFFKIARPEPGEPSYREGKHEQLDQDSIMDSLTSRALGWLMTNSQDARSIDAALQAIAGADRRLPIEPLLDCGAHHLVTQRFRNCFLSHPQSGFSYLSNPLLLDAASLYGRSLAFFMSDLDHVSRIETVLRKGPGGGFAIRRAFQCLQYDYARSRPNVAAFGLVGLSAWWDMRLHTGQPSPGVLPDALSMLKRHATGEKILHPHALVALIDTVAEESQHWMTRLLPRERARYPVQLLQLLDQMDQLSLSHARPAIALCLTSLAFVFADRISVGEALQGTGFQSPGHKLLSYYAYGDHRDRDAESLLVYGLLGLLSGRRAYELKDTEISAVADQLVAVYEIKPPPSGRRLPFISSSADLGTIAIETILPTLSPVASDPVFSKEVRARLLQALLPYSYMWGSSSLEIYSTIADNLRLPHSDSLKLIWTQWLGTQWTTYYASDMFCLLDRYRTFPHILGLIATPGTGSLEYAAIPFAMAHCWAMTNHIVKWNRRWGGLTGHGHFGTALASIISQLSNGITEAPPSGTAPLPSLLTRVAEAWVSRLELLSTQIPMDVLNSGILKLLAESYTSNQLAERVEELINTCNLHATSQTY